MALTATFSPIGTPSSSPDIHPKQEITLENAQKTLEGLTEAVKKLAAAIHRSKSTSEEATKTSAEEKDKSGEGKLRGSKLEIKKVDEVWDNTAYNYSIAESVLATKMTELEEYVFVDRTRIDKMTGEPTYYIDVNSQILRKTLKEAIGEVNGVNLHEDKPSIQGHLIYNLLPRLEAHLTGLNQDLAGDATSRLHLEHLIRYIKTSYSSVTTALQSLLAHGEITFDLLWALFYPKEIIFTEDTGTGRPQCLEYDHGEVMTVQGQTFYGIEGRYLDFDGRNLGEISNTLYIPKFHGTKRIDSLNVFPLQRHIKVDDVTTELMERGRKFIKLMGTHYRHYCGLACITRNKKQVKMCVNSRVMIDAVCFRVNNPNYFKRRLSIETLRNESILSNFNLFDPEDEDENVGNDWIKGEGHTTMTLTRENLLRCNAIVLGYSFDQKLWLEFAVTDLREIEWQPQMFDHLAMPQEKKDMILSLAQARAGDSNLVPFDDIVPGKGGGLNILLHGPPGVGKTLTAEAIAERLQRPLYSISTGELGIDASYLEDRLTQIFDIASRWKAVILFDEADTYMEQRSSSDIQRNGLVSVFLRKLEYCQAIMFLTTNRVREFDDAVLSRIHVMIAFESIGQEDRKKLWETFIEKGRTTQGSPRISKKEVSKLAQKELNGRQIKNVLAAAHAMAGMKGSVIEYRHLQDAINQGDEFMDDFNKMTTTRSLYN